MIEIEAQTFKLMSGKQFLAATIVDEGWIKEDFSTSQGISISNVYENIFNSKLGFI